MKHEYTVVIQQDEAGYYVAEVPELPGCHTQAKSLDVLLRRIREAIALCQEEYGEGLPRTQLVGIQKVAV